MSELEQRYIAKITQGRKTLAELMSHDVEKLRLQLELLVSPGDPSVQVEIVDTHTGQVITMN